MSSQQTQDAGAPDEPGAVSRDDNNDVALALALARRRAPSSMWWTWARVATASPSPMVQDSAFGALCCARPAQ